MSRTGRRLRITGIVQGVGFRPWVYRAARRAGVDGSVRNDSTGVVIEAFGEAVQIAAFERDLADGRPPAARVNRIEATSIPPRPVTGFHIVESGTTADRRVSIPPDLATCEACLAELRDPRDRRYGYAFTNCTDCGPRFTITREVPYDRAQTTMAAFVMCEACRAEYSSPESRRFHAEPNACPACGPRLAWLERLEEESAPVTTDAIARAAVALRAGNIVAVKGLGGVHLACDATSPAAVSRLRRRKRRDEKPFAVMVRDLAEADRLAEVGTAARRLLAGVERPIVLVRRRDPDRPSRGSHDLAPPAVDPAGTESGRTLAAEVAPRNPLVGLMLPYTPLHHLLLDAVGRPLVMTSGNLAEEPLAHRNEEAIERLRHIADHALLHDRDIDAPCDDSVARVVSGRPLLIRRSRGYVPRGIPLPHRVRRPVLGVGALLKSAVCLATRDHAWPGPHVGDLDNLATLRFFERAVTRLERFLRVRPELVAHDLHPEYASTAYALARRDVHAVGVQHHHAHVAAVMAEHGRHEPVLGLAYDGTGYGSDGTSWGGELLLARLDGFERLATFRPMALAGGDTAVREVWRLALAVLLDAFDGAPPLERLGLFDAVPLRARTVVGQLIARGLQAPPAHGLGRYFDAFGALILGRTHARFEGQVALELNGVADMAGAEPWPFEIDWTRTPWQVDLRPAVRALVARLLDEPPSGSAARADGETPPPGAARLAGRFHATIIAASEALLGAAVRRHGRLPVALSGGCFQNDILAERLEARLRPGVEVLVHQQVPPGDGGIALGQCVVADAVTGP
jgi:hydrogenase maturation protein HypF